MKPSRALDRGSKIISFFSISLSARTQNGAEMISKRSLRCPVRHCSRFHGNLAGLQLCRRRLACHPYGWRSSVGLSRSLRTRGVAVVETAIVFGGGGSPIAHPNRPERAPVVVILVLPRALLNLRVAAGTQKGLVTVCRRSLRNRQFEPPGSMPLRPPV